MREPPVCWGAGGVDWLGVVPEEESDVPDVVEEAPAEGPLELDG
jgi:hypothetical protein